jgi:hypothetical protein
MAERMAWVLTRTLIDIAGDEQHAVLPVFETGEQAIAFARLDATFMGAVMDRWQQEFVPAFDGDYDAGYAREWWTAGAPFCGELGTLTRLDYTASLVHFGDPGKLETCGMGWLRDIRQHGHG